MKNKPNDMGKIIQNIIVENIEDLCMQLILNSSYTSVDQISL